MCAFWGVHGLAANAADVLPGIGVSPGDLTAPTRACPALCLCCNDNESKSPLTRPEGPGLTGRCAPPGRERPAGQEWLTGLERLTAVTALLQRIRLQEPRGGVWEAGRSRALAPRAICGQEGRERP
jgi:hypothetical protein